MLRVIERTFATPDENLAFDDELLESRTAVLRLWESPSPFVVLGRSGQADREVNLPACRIAGIPVVRRSSGGGTVLQGPGCLNYSVVWPLAQAPALWNVTRSYAVLLGWVAQSLAVPGLTVCGSDILLAGRKVSGNAQRRANGWLLHHGTLLHGLDMALVEQLLAEPLRQPPHRRGRRHTEFMSTLPLSGPVLMQRLAACFEDGSVCSPLYSCLIAVRGSIRDARLAGM